MTSDDKTSPAEGYVMVPRVPTTEMIVEGMHYASAGIACEVYRAMLAARPASSPDREAIARAARDAYNAEIAAVASSPASTDDVSDGWITRAAPPPVQASPAKEPTP